MSRDDDLVTPPRDEPIRQMLLDSVAAEPERRRRNRHRGFIVWGSIGVLVAASAGIGAGVVVHARSVSNTSVVHCLSSAHEGLGGKYPDASAALGSPSGATRVTDARDLCRQIWTQGVFEPGYNPRSDDNPAGKAPDELTVCVMKDGSAAVVPGAGPDLCSSIGLAPLK